MILAPVGLERQHVRVVHGGVEIMRARGSVGWLTHIVIVFFVLELAAAGDGCYDG